MTTRLERYWTRYVIGLIAGGALIALFPIGYATVKQPREVYTAVKHAVPWFKPDDTRAVEANCDPVTATDAEILHCVADMPPPAKPLTDTETAEALRRYGITD